MSARDYDLTDEKDIQLYLRDVELEYSFQCFDQKEADGCHRLGVFKQQYLKTLAAAAVIFKENCNERKYSESCFKYAQILQSGKGTPEEKADVAAAQKYYEKSCDLGYSNGCIGAGLNLVQMGSQERNDDTISKGVAFLDQACKAGNVDGCLHLFSLYMMGNSVKKDLKKAFEFANKGCDLDNIHSCNNLSLMYRHGNGVEKNIEMADEIKRKFQRLYEKDWKPSPEVKVNE